MQHYLPPLCQQAIKHVCHDARNIRFPDVVGMAAPVFLADTNNKTMVFKFNDEQIIKKNLIASHLMQQYDIPMPDITIHSYQGTWFESYEYNPAKTLYEHIQSGMPNSKIYEVYKNLIQIQNKIMRIPVDAFLPTQYRYHHEVLSEHLQNMPPPISVCRKMLSYNARAGKQYLLHNDIQPKNVLFDSKNNKTFLLDLDAIGLCNEHFAALKMLYQCPIDNIDEIIDLIESETHKKMPHHAMKFACNIMDCYHAHRRQIIDAWKNLSHIKHK